MNNCIIGWLVIFSITMLVMSAGYLSENKNLMWAGLGVAITCFVTWTSLSLSGMIKPCYRNCNNDQNAHKAYLCNSIEKKLQKVSDLIEKKE